MAWLQHLDLFVEGTAEVCRAESDGSQEVVGWAKLGEPRVIARNLCLVGMHRGTRKNTSPLQGQAEQELTAGSSCDRMVALN